MSKSNIAKLKMELEELIKKGDLLHAALAMDHQKATPKVAAKLKGIKKPSFRDEYETWYSLAMRVIRQLIPDRLPDFIRQYRDEKRKEINALTYGIADYMVGIQTLRNQQVELDGTSAIPKFMQQLNILKSALSRFDNSLFDMAEIVQADLFDNELAAAQELARKGFGRGAGAIAGVVLERHLGSIANKHNLHSRKSAPAINDLNQLLRDNDVIDIPTWRSIQHLGDLRNLCDHDKGRDPTKDQVLDLVSGVSKIIKTIL